MWLAILFALTKADVCDVSLNDAVDSINKDCNYAGRCYNGKCYCCDTTAVSDYCQEKVPGTWVGEKCKQATVYTQVTWGYLFETDSITCGNGTASPDLLSQTIALLSDYYDGEIMYLECDYCSVGSPCTFFSEPPVANSGVFLKFGTDLNTFYDLDCSNGDLPDTIRHCEDNWDNGANAYMAMMEGLDQENSYVRFITDLKTLLTSSGDDGLSSLASELTRVWNAEVEVLSTTVQTTRLPTPAPTPEPTSSPTGKPTELEVDTKFCRKYINSINDLHYLGVGSSCRGNIKESWTGGRTCESPYIICLPGENTPTNDMMGNPYKSDTYRYNVTECLQECSYDQRCLGIEFVADAGSTLGDCNLIDDIPVAVEDEVFSYTYHQDHVNLDSSITGGDALCWAKINYCNPYFEAEDLNPVMLDC